MNREDIIRMAREVGFEQNSLGMTYTSGALPELLERFAAIVAAAEREECEAERERLFWDHNVQGISADKLAPAIRARGEK